MRLLLGLVLAALQAAQKVESALPHAERMQEILDWISDEQWKDDQEYFPKGSLPITQYHRKGFYKSTVRFNFHGPPPARALRNEIFFDETVGGQGYIVKHVMDAARYGAELASDEEFAWAVEGIYRFKERNHAPDDPMFVYWEEELRPNGAWEPYSSNIFESGKVLGAYMRNVGLEEPFSLFTTRVNWCADVDSTSTYIDMLMTAEEATEDYPLAASKASMKWSKITKYFDNNLHYSYRPFLANASHDERAWIDTKSYWFVRDFLKERLDAGDTNLALTFTWYIFPSEVEEKYYYYGPKLFTWSNHVDAYIFTRMILTSIKIFENYNPTYDRDEEYMHLLVSNTKLVEWMLRVNYFARGDYFNAVYWYPTKTMFYRGVANLNVRLNSLDMAKFSNPTVRQGLEEIRDILNVAMRSYGTEQLLSLGRAEGPYFVWDEHLGKGDMPPMDEDRVFCTAFAAVALMDTWAVETPTDKHNRVGMRFIDQTPEKIKKAIKGAMTWLLEESDGWSRGNVAFFAFWSSQTLSFNYPHWPRDFMYVMTELPPRQTSCADTSLNLTVATFALKTAVQGYVEPALYDQLLDEQKNCLGRQGGREATTINTKSWTCGVECTFLFERCDAFTMSMEFLAIAKYDALLLSGGFGDDWALPQKSPNLRSKVKKALQGKRHSGMSGVEVHPYLAG